jgi:5-formyltetrahydrofolate cyclo-ligase
MLEPTPTKTELRRHYKLLRDRSTPRERREWSEQIGEHLSTLCAAAGLLRVGLFGPFGSEVDLRPFEFANPEISFFFPRVASQDPARLAWGPRPLEPGTWGLQEPTCAPYPAPPVQLLLVPGLAFAADGHRLGYGKGFYDSVLATLMDDILVLGVAFDLQRCHRLPTNPRDLPVSGLATQSGLTWIDLNPT